MEGGGGKSGERKVKRVGGGMGGGIEAGRGAEGKKREERPGTEKGDGGKGRGQWKDVALLRVEGGRNGQR